MHAEREINAGLFGFLIISDPKRSRDDGTPADINRELRTGFVVFDERHAEDEDSFAVPLPEDSIMRQNFIQHRLNETVAELQRAEQSGHHSVNGRIFGNVSELEMILGERVRWYVFALGSEKDMDTAHWHGVRRRNNGRMTDTIELLPGSITTFDFRAENEGNWLFQCHAADHMMEGMYAAFAIHAKASTNSARPQLSRFYSQAREQNPFNLNVSKSLKKVKIF